jgi:hypothetical protein
MNDARFKKPSAESRQFRIPTIPRLRQQVKNRDARLTQSLLHQRGQSRPTQRRLHHIARLGHGQIIQQHAKGLLLSFQPDARIRMIPLHELRPFGAMPPKQVVPGFIQIHHVQACVHFQRRQRRHHAAAGKTHHPNPTTRLKLRHQCRQHIKHTVRRPGREPQFADDHAMLTEPQSVFGFRNVHARSMSQPDCWVTLAKQLPMDSFADNRNPFDRPPVVTFYYAKMKRRLICSFCRNQSGRA